MRHKGTTNRLSVFPNTQHSTLLQNAACLFVLSTCSTAHHTYHICCSAAMYRCTITLNTRACEKLLKGCLQGARLVHLYRPVLVLMPICSHSQGMPAATTDNSGWCAAQSWRSDYRKHLLQASRARRLQEQVPAQPQCRPHWCCCCCCRCFRRHLQSCCFIRFSAEVHSG